MQTLLFPLLSLPEPGAPPHLVGSPPLPPAFRGLSVYTRIFSFLLGFVFGGTKPLLCSALLSAPHLLAMSRDWLSAFVGGRKEEGEGDGGNAALGGVRPVVCTNRPVPHLPPHWRITPTSLAHHCRF